MNTSTPFRLRVSFWNAGQRHEQYYNFHSLAQAMAGAEHQRHKHTFISAELYVVVETWTKIETGTPTGTTGGHR